MAPSHIPSNLISYDLAKLAKAMISHTKPAKAMLRGWEPCVRDKRINTGQVGKQALEHYSRQEHRNSFQITFKGVF